VRVRAGREQGRERAGGRLSAHVGANWATSALPRGCPRARSAADWNTHADIIES
jgi:hypothetical protein